MFDISNLVILSSVVYYDEWDDVEKFINENYKDFKFKYFDVLNTECFIIHDNKNCVLVFRGTSEIKDIFTDINIIRIDTPIGVVHQGFYKSWLNVSEQIFEYLYNNKLTINHEFYITGHSLGAAIATIAAVDIYFRTKILSNVTVFGSPRVFSHKTANKINAIFRDKIKRYVNNNDIVSRIPIFIRYKHVGIEYYITSDKYIKVGYIFRKKLHEFINAFKNKNYFDPTNDHFISSYVSILSSGKLKNIL